MINGRKGWLLNRVDYPTITLSQMLEEAARRWPKRTAYICFGVRISYAEFVDPVNRAPEACGRWESAPAIESP
jgi:acyl-CoA synthetase (AMP-forming)/AMP-acid ligase II